MNSYLDDSIPISILDLNKHSSVDHFKQSGCPYHKKTPEKVKEIPYEIFPIHMFEFVCIPFSEDAFENLNRAIEKIVGSVECLTSCFDTCCCRWRLYYGTPPIEKMLTDEQRLTYNNKNIMLQDMLIKKYIQDHPSLADSGPLSNTWVTASTEEEYKEEQDEFERILSRREWCVSEIIITRKMSISGQNILSCHFNRLCGSRTTAMYIFSELRDNIHSFDLLQSQIMESRIAFLQFTEGVSTGKLDNNHIYRYACNDLLVRELCSFIPYRKYI